jgi:hypothetical protein
MALKPSIGDHVLAQRRMLAQQLLLLCMYHDHVCSAGAAATSCRWASQPSGLWRVQPTAGPCLTPQQRPHLARQVGVLLTQCWLAVMGRQQQGWRTQMARRWRCSSSCKAGGGQGVQPTYHGPGWLAATRWIACFCLVWHLCMCLLHTQDMGSKMLCRRHAVVEEGRLVHHMSTQPWHA